jgi:hypothetical protein
LWQHLRSVELRGKLKDLKLNAITKQAQSTLKTQMIDEAVYDPGESNAGNASLEILRGRVMIVKGK